MDSNEGPYLPQALSHPHIPGVVRFVTDRFQDCRQHVRKALQRWQDPEGVQDVLESLTSFKGALPHRKRRRRKDARFASLSVGLHGDGGPFRPCNLAVDGLCVASDKKANKGKAQVTFPSPRREEQERILISEVRKCWRKSHLNTELTLTSCRWISLSYRDILK